MYFLGRNYPILVFLVLIGFENCDFSIFGIDRVKKNVILVFLGCQNHGIDRVSMPGCRRQAPV